MRERGLRDAARLGLSARDQGVSWPRDGGSWAGAGVQAGGETGRELAEWSQRLQVQICSLGEGGPGGVGSGGPGGRGVSSQKSLVSSSPWREGRWRRGRICHREKLSLFVMTLSCQSDQPLQKALINQLVLC